MNSSLLERRLLLLTGKGGVGKTTMVAALAVHAASLGMRPLVVELGHRESMRSVFGTTEIGFKPKDVGLGVHAMSVDIDLAVLDYMLQHIPSKRVAKTIVGNKVLERLFKAMPAVGEIATVNKLRQLEAETMPGGAHRWSPILVDLDATGHALMFLELRNTLQHIMGAGPMRRLVEEVASLIADPRATRLCLVTLPGELPVTETIELHQRLQLSKTVPLGPVFVNKVPRLGIEPGDFVDIQAIDFAAQAVGSEAVLGDTAFARAALHQSERARDQIDRLRAHVETPIVELPKLATVRLQADELAMLGALALGGDRE